MLMELWEILAAHLLIHRIAYSRMASTFAVRVWPLLRLKGHHLLVRPAGAVYSAVP